MQKRRKQKRTATKIQIKKERDPQKLKKVLKQKGYKGGSLPKGKVPHHVKPVAMKGKTTKKNVHVVAVGKHKKIHRNRRKIGKI